MYQIVLQTILIPHIANVGQVAVGEVAGITTGPPTHGLRKKTVLTVGVGRLTMKSAGITTGNIQTLVKHATAVITAPARHHARHVQVASAANIEVEAAVKPQIGILLVPPVKQNQIAEA